MLVLCRSTRRLTISTLSELSEKVWVWGVIMKGWGARALAARRICMHRVHCAPFVLPLRRAQRSPQITAPLQVSSGLVPLRHAGEQLGASQGTRPHPTPLLALFPKLHLPPDARALIEHPVSQLAQGLSRLVLHAAPWLMAPSSSPFFGLLH